MTINQLISSEKITEIEPVVKQISSSVDTANSILATLADLINASIAEKVASLAKKIKCEAIVKVALTGLDKVLEVFLKILDFLREQTMQLTALSGASALLQPIVTSIDDLIYAGMTDLNKLGIPMPQIIEGAGNQESALSEFTNQAGDFLAAYRAFIDLLPEYTVWGEMKDSVQKIQGFSTAFKTQLG